MRTLIALAAVLALAACTNPNTTRRVAENSGLTNVEITGWRMFGCSEGETGTGFRATNAQGQEVTGVVCSQFLKGNTLRLD